MVASLAPRISTLKISSTKSHVAHCQRDLSHQKSIKLGDRPKPVPQLLSIPNVWRICVVGLFIFLSCAFFIWFFLQSTIYCCRFAVNRPQIIYKNRNKVATDCRPRRFPLRIFIFHIFFSIRLVVPQLIASLNGSKQFFPYACY